MSEPHHPQSPAAGLMREPYVFDFFQAVRLLEGLPPHRRAVGREGSPESEAVRFAANAALGFPASQIDRIEPPASEELPPKMFVNFFGLTGPNGVLPLVYSQWVIARNRVTGDAEAHATADWLDQFTHRMLSMFYRAWAKYRLPVAFEEGQRTELRDPITRALLCLLGLGTPGLSGRFLSHSSDRPEASVDDLALLRYAGLLSGSARPAAGLERLLADFFRVSVHVASFHGRWLPLDAENQTCLGRRREMAKLGAGVLVGRRVWDVVNAIRIRIGPLDAEAFLKWLPDQPRLEVLIKLVRFYTRDGLDFDVQLVLAGSAVTTRQLGLHGEGTAPRLGWNIWLVRRSVANDLGDAVFRRNDLLKTPARN